MERLAQYIILNPFSVNQLQPNSSRHSIICRSGLNPKIQSNFVVFNPCDFFARTPAVLGASRCRAGPHL
jgi:hypothetical protein